MSEMTTRQREEDAVQYVGSTTQRAAQRLPKNRRSSFWIHRREMSDRLWWLGLDMAATEYLMKPNNRSNHA